MNNIEYKRLFSDQRNPVLALIVVFLFTVAGVLLIGPVLGIGFTTLIYNIDAMSLDRFLQQPETFENGRKALLLYQGASALGAFLTPVLLYFSIYERKNPFILLPIKGLEDQMLVMAVLATFCFMIVNTVFIEWNANMDLPGFLQPFEDWAKNMEDQLREVTEFLTKFDSVSYFLAAIVVVAIIPAIVEELLFRGAIQNIFFQISKNHHLAIWLAAILFSAIHVQFYGFIPRVLLGALFGYLYVWSGNIWLAVLGHFVNNGISLLVLYLYQQDKISYDVESDESAPWYAILPFLIIFIASMVFLYRHYKKLHGKVEESI
jgi:membrane protease YdiL (CAAX protease family)